VLLREMSGSFATEPSQQKFRRCPLCRRNRVNSAGTVVAHSVRYAAPVVPNELIGDGSALGEPHERANLIGSHETAVALHVGSEDCDELTPDRKRFDDPLKDLGLTPFGIARA
jgi:hypothetical protein